MLYLKQLRLKNFCSYEDYTFDFCRKDGSPYPFVCFFGPNGIGKSTCLEAIALLTANWMGRPAYMIRESLRKFIRNTDYDPAYEGMKGFKYGAKDREGDAGYIKVEAGQTRSDLGEMVIRGTYSMDGKDYVVELTQDGYTRNDFAPLPPPNADPDDAPLYSNDGPWGENHLQHRQRVCHFVSADSDLSLSKFQLRLSQAEAFEKLISEIMRYKADCVAPSSLTEHEKDYCTDFVITKKDHRIHYRRMSAGERKICKSFSELLNLMDDLSNPKPGEPKMEGWPRLLLMDNVEIHVYWDRHVTFIDCLKRVFNQQQIFATTHSGILVPRYLEGKNDSETELYIDLEKING